MKALVGVFNNANALVRAFSGHCENLATSSGDGKHSSIGVLIVRGAG